jgi:urease accessory protein
MRHVSRLLVVAFAVLFPFAASAHVGVGDTSGFVHGFSHPLSGIDHILAMVAVGMFAAHLGGRALWLVPLTFVSGIAVCRDRNRPFGCDAWSRRCP